MDTPAWGWIELGQLLLSLVLGLLIGVQRERHHKPAGFTTISIVTVTSTLVMQVSSLLGSRDGPVDPARLAAAVLTGIGFLGAGVILRTGRSIHGITTAATIWMMAAVGLAVGAGLYLPAIAMVAIVWVCFLIDPWVGRMVKKTLSPPQTDAGPEPSDNADE